jgi:hypothetical protein
MATLICQGGQQRSFLEWRTISNHHKTNRAARNRGVKIPSKAAKARTWSAMAEWNASASASGKTNQNVRNKRRR